MKKKKDKGSENNSQIIIDELIDNFGFLGDWEERFSYLIELGKNLPAIEPEEKIEEKPVQTQRKSRFAPGSPVQSIENPKLWEANI